MAVFSSGSCVHTLEDTKYITLNEEKVTDYLSTLLRFSFILRVYKTVRNMLLKMTRQRRITDDVKEDVTFIPIDGRQAVLSDSIERQLYVFERNV